MIIDGLQKLTLLDYPQKLACVIYTKGCNFACPFCQNSSLISNDKKQGKISEEEILAYLKKRKNILEGVVISGGEPLVQKNIKEFIQKIKELDYDVKLDTNGSNPILLKQLIDDHLIDYVAMDIKNTFSKYSLNIGTDTKLDNIKKSIKILKENKVAYEFRTTIVKEFNTLDDIWNICKYIGKDAKYFLQNFEDSSDVLNHQLHGFSKDELIEIERQIKRDFPKVEIRTLS